MHERNGGGWELAECKAGHSVSLPFLTLGSLAEQHGRDGEEVPGLAQVESTLTLTGAGIFTEAVSNRALTLEGTKGVGADASPAQSA